MQFIIGDKVSFLNEKLNGIVTKIINKSQVEVTTDDGFGIPVLTTELVKVFTELELVPEIIKKPIVLAPVKEEVADEIVLKKEIEVIGREQIKKAIQEKMQTKVIGKISLKHSHKRKDVEDEVDLHIENLLDAWKTMSNGEIVVHQLAIARKRIDDAILQGKHRLVIIHGIGNGTLKAEIRKLINSYYGIRCEDGSFGKYGAGATLVHL